MSRLLMIAGVVLLLASCVEKGSAPSGVLSQQKMQAVLYDIMLTDALTSNQVMKDTMIRINDANAVLFEKVFALHKISRQEFLKSYSYYLRHPDLLKPVTDSLSAIINRQNSEMDKPDTTLRSPKQMRDSFMHKPKLLKNGDHVQDAAGQVGDSK